MKDGKMKLPCAHQITPILFRVLLGRCSNSKMNMPHCLSRCIILTSIFSDLLPQVRRFDMDTTLVFMYGVTSSKTKFSVNCHLSAGSQSFATIQPIKVFERELLYRLLNKQEDNHLYTHFVTRIGLERVN